MRRLRLLGVILALALVAASCGDDGDEPASAPAASATEEPAAEPEPAAEEPAAEEPEPEPAAEEPEPEPAAEEPAEEEPAAEPAAEDSRRGGTLVIALSDDPGHFNPGITTGFNVHAVTGSMFNGLVELDDNANPHPDLAESWEVSDDSTTYTFHLAEGVRWHDGEPMTSADVKFTFENILLNYHSRTRGGLSSILDSIDTPDDTTVVFNFTQPYAALLQRLNSTEAPILPKHIYEGVDDVQTADANLTPVGTGPFKLESYDIDNEIT
ncbi:MAG: hypothetical protein F4046_11165, partial [Acidimicrobiaceae bacterium]|nr:hypothetical protein [Acidimicrobiaceae bacterium]